MPSVDPAADDAGRATLDVERIVRAAVALADADGWPAVSMRRLAGELSVTPMALYWHVENKERLLDEMAAAVLADLEVPSIAAGDRPWDRRLNVLLHALIAMFRRHRWMCAVALDRFVLLPDYLAALEALLAAVRGSGVDVRTGTRLVQHIVLSLVAMVAQQPSGHDPGGDAERACRELEDRFAALPVERYPQVHAAAAALAGRDDVEEYYATGVAMLVGGVAAVARRGPRPSRSSPSE